MENSPGAPCRPGMTKEYVEKVGQDELDLRDRCVRLCDCTVLRSLLRRSSLSLVTDVTGGGRVVISRPSEHVMSGQPGGSCRQRSTVVRREWARRPQRYRAALLLLAGLRPIRAALCTGVIWTRASEQAARRRPLALDPSCARVTLKRAPAAAGPPVKGWTL